MQTCQVCSKENPAGVEYCEDCGAALTAAPQPVPGGSGAATAPAGAGAQASSMAPASGAANLTPGALPSTPAADSAAVPPAPEGVAPPAAATSTTAGDTPASASAATSSAPAAPPTGAAAPSRGARLVVKRYGATTAEEIPLVGERLIVGRFDPETGPVDVDLSASPEAVHISRHHGELYREADGRWFVRDLGSTNGVFVKAQAATAFGPRITAPQTLADGDEIAFGNARFVFRTT
jgi:hypothetical protein